MHRVESMSTAVFKSVTASLNCRRRAYNTARSFKILTSRGLACKRDLRDSSLFWLIVSFRLLEGIDFSLRLLLMIFAIVFAEIRALNYSKAKCLHQATA